MDGSGITEQLTVWCPEEGLTIEFDRPEILAQKLAPRLQRRQDVEWFGVIHPSKGAPGGFGRLKATGGLVEVFDRWLCIARPSIAAAFSAALDEELRRLLHEADPAGSQAGACTGPS